MDFSSIVPRDSHDALAWLGKIDWLATELQDGLRTVLTVRWTVIEGTPGFDQHEDKLRHYLSPRPNTRIHLTWFDACAACLAKGPKIFVPTAEQFESMTHVDLKLPIRDLRLPYPALVVKVPRDARPQLAKDSGLIDGDARMVPEWVLVRERDAPGQPRSYMIGTRQGPYSHPGSSELSYFFMDRPEFPDVEAAISARRLKPGDDTRHFLVSSLCGRAALNLCLMMVHYGHKLSGPLDPKQWVRNRNPKKHPERSCKADFRTVEMTQAIVVRELDTRPPSPDRGGGGWEVKPHWRKGCWRRPPGTAPDAAKTVFVRPCLVRPDRAVGDLKDSRALYQTPAGQAALP